MLIEPKRFGSGYKPEPTINLFCIEKDSKEEKLNITKIHIIQTTIENNIKY
jgi:hypothetical protein